LQTVELIVPVIWNVLYMPKTPQVSLIISKACVSVYFERVISYFSFFIYLISN